MPNAVKPYSWGALLLALLLSCFALSSPALADDDELDQDDAPALVQGDDELDSEESNEELDDDQSAAAGGDQDELDDDEDDGGRGLLYGIFAGTLAVGAGLGIGKWRRRVNTARQVSNAYRSSGSSSRPPVTPRTPSTGRSGSRRRTTDSDDDEMISEQPGYPDYGDTPSGGGDSGDSFGGGD